MSKKIFIVCGEESGDLHGSTLMKALKKLDPGITVGGMGGARMREEGLKGLDSRAVSVVGITEVIEKLPGIFRAFNELKADLKDGGFDAVVLIDLPDFNLRFAKEAKRLGIPVIYYISPQVWAWRKGRVKKIARLVDKMLVVFPFEAEFYKGAGVDVEYVGHPLSDTAKIDLSKAEARKLLNIPDDATVVGLLPGSRTGELKRLLSPMLRSGELIEAGLKKKVRFLLPAADSLDDSLINDYLRGSKIEVQAVRRNMYAALRASDAAIVASGTASLETALIGTPMVIVYRMSAVSYMIAKLLVDLKDVGLPNIVAGKRVVPELIQDEVNPEAISREILAILTDGSRRAEMEKACVEIREKLGRGGAAENAAKEIFKVISRRQIIPAGA